LISLFFSVKYTTTQTINKGTEMDLKKLRKKKGMSQTDVARELGVHLNTYSLWEKRVGCPNPQNLEKLKKIFGIK